MSNIHTYSGICKPREEDERKEGRYIDEIVKAIALMMDMRNRQKAGLIMDGASLVQMVLIDCI